LILPRMIRIRLSDCLPPCRRTEVVILIQMVRVNSKYRVEIIFSHPRRPAEPRPARRGPVRGQRQAARSVPERPPGSTGRARKPA